MAFDGRPVPFELAQYIATVKEGFRTVRLEFDSAVVAREGVVKSSQFLLGAAEIHVGKHVGGLDQQRSTKQLDRRGHFIFLQGDDAQQMKGLEMPRVESKNFLIRRPGFIQPRLLMKCDGSPKCGLS